MGSVRYTYGEQSQRRKGSGEKAQGALHSGLASVDLRLLPKRIELLSHNSNKMFMLSQVHDIGLIRRKRSCHGNMISPIAMP